MSQQKKFQSFDSVEGLKRNGNFENGEIICGQIAITEILLLSIVPRETPDEFMKENPPVNFRGKVFRVNPVGEVLSFMLITNIQPRSSDAKAISSSEVEVIELSSLKSYYIDFH
ncbi:MAG TPA: hypothetical protein VK203_16535 [Nostocaceae cyanobacterium]|nr:hypothetical protein [Nostocaceae cyanobacterium]